jgi:Tol biopolymer transport system component
VLWLLPAAVGAQFYNGHQMKFGKNRVQYNTFYWKFYRFDRFDVYSYEEGTELSLYVADYVKNEIIRIERFFDYDFEKRLIFIVYNKLSDFKQSNIGQMITDEEEESNIGGMTRIIQNKIFIFFEGDHKKLERQITQSISEALVYEMLYGNDFKDNFTSSTLLNLPEWYIKGLVSYISQPWDFELENRVKDGIVNERYTKFNKLEGVDALYAGHSFWKYIADTYGASVIPNILYLTRINKNSNTGFLYVLGLPLKDLSNEWLGYYYLMFEESESMGNLPSSGKLISKPKKNKVYVQAKISPDGNYIAYVTNEMGQVRVYIHDTRIGKTRKLHRDGHKLDQITDYSYPVITWHPSSKIIAWVAEEEGTIRLTYYDIDLDEYSSRLFLYFEKILDISYSDDGLRFVISGVHKGQTDIYVHNIASAANEQITNDIADDLNPRFFNRSTQIVFTSNRKEDLLNIPNDPASIDDVYQVFVYDYRNRSENLRRISERNYANHIKPFSYQGNEFIYLSDQSGVYNRYLARFDSAISYIDTITHYRYFSRSFPLTNYRRNIVDQHYAPGVKKYTETIFNKGKYEIYQGDLIPSSDLVDEVKQTAYRAKLSRELAVKDSLSQIKKKTISLKDVIDNSIIAGNDTIQLEITAIDVNNYIFEKEKLRFYNERLSKSNVNLVMDTIVRQRMMYIDYETSFYPTYLVNQVDFSFLNASYQTFTGGAVYYNPGFNMMFKVGANDLFEDYRIIGGVRLASDFDSNEFLFSFEDLKGRWDKQVVFHRQVFKASSTESLLKTFTHEMWFMMKYPFSQVAAFKGTAMFRNDRSVFLSTDLSNLNEPDIIKPWIGLKGEYVFDNTRFLGVNLYQGLRYKLFAEGYKQVDAKKSDLVVLGADFRHYTRVHRTLIWANRFAASSSFGHTPLIYYLGSVDNWTNLNPNVQVFDESVPIDYSRNYAFQTLATNMRGFTQNIRNGNNFVVYNTEIRWPVFRYLINRPLSSAFLNNFQLLGFFDAGTAWAGLHPWAGENEYDTEEYTNGPVRVVVDSNRDPLVAGYGFGVRSRLFGYFVRLDWAWGIENRTVLPRMFYLSLNLDF